MKIVLIHNGTDYEALLLTSLAIGLKKKYANAKILWAGRPEYFPLVKFNKRVKKCLNINNVYDLASLTHFYKSDVCINPYPDKIAIKFTEICAAEKYYGFTKDGAIDHNAELFKNVIYGDLTTNKTVLDLYYGLVDMKWRGEGYGLSYYPRHKQSKDVGIYMQNHPDIEGDHIKMPSNLFAKFDILNEYQHVVTDDMFALHASLALRKKATFYGSLPYSLNFGGQKSN